MLVLSRKRLESITIGDDVKVTVIRVDRNQVRLGIEAPGNMTILRDEILLDEEERVARKAWTKSERRHALDSKPVGRSEA